jgi:hypothetical protein
MKVSKNQSNGKISPRKENELRLLSPFMLWKTNGMNNGCKTFLSEEDMTKSYNSKTNSFIASSLRERERERKKTERERESPMTGSHNGAYILCS